jgi:hypothetical protein
LNLFNPGWSTFAGGAFPLFGARMNALVRRAIVRERIHGATGPPMPGKRVQFDEETWAAIDLLAKDTMGDFQELADEAFRDLLAKHGRPVGLKDQLKRSLRSGERAEGDGGASGTPSSGQRKRPAGTAKRGRRNDAA